MKNFLRLVKRVWRRVGDMRFVSILQVAILRFIASFSLLTALYYYFRRVYHLEQRGDLLGRIDRLDDTCIEGGTPFYQLVRNVHSLERGLCVKEGRRPVFAEGYILSTVMDLGQVIKYQDAEQAIARESMIALSLIHI